MKANSILGCISMGTASGLRVELPFLYLPFIRLHLGTALGPQFKKITEKLEFNRGHQDGRGAGALTL